MLLLMLLILFIGTLTLILTRNCNAFHSIDFPSPPNPIPPIPIPPNPIPPIPIPAPDPGDIFEEALEQGGYY